jgi:hypothetical protein
LAWPVGPWISKENSVVDLGAKKGLEAPALEGVDGFGAEMVTGIE